MKKRRPAEAYAARQKTPDRTGGDADRFLLQRLNSAILGTQSAIKAYLAMQVALVPALTARLPEKQRPSVDEILNLMRNMEPDRRQAAERESLRYFLDTYRTLSDAELDRYIVFAESAPGRKYHAAVVDAIMEAMLHASRRLRNKPALRAARTRPGLDWNRQAGFTVASPFRKAAIGKRTMVYCNEDGLRLLTGPSWRCVMREFRCAGLGFHCSWRHIATDELLTEMAALHLRDVHGVKRVDSDMYRKIRSAFSRPLTKEVAAAAAQGMKEYSCDLRPGCGWRYLAMNADLIADGAAVHARAAHGIRTFTPEMIAQVKNSIHEWKRQAERNAA